MANNPIALDFNDLIYYDTKIKKYVDDKADLITAAIPDTYTKDEIDTKIAEAYKADLIKIDSRIDSLAEQVSANTAKIISHREELNDIEARIVNLERDDISINDELESIKLNLKDKANVSDIPSLTDYATKDDLKNLVTVEYVTENYTTTEQVEQVIAKEVTENTEIQQSIAQGVAKQIETINYGTFGEV